MSNLRAEVMSVGDEIISGQRLDTNTQWLSQALGDLGIPVHFHSSVGDDLNDHVAALEIAIERADVLVLTGGLGPTADDLTRQAIADAIKVPVDFDEATLNHIEKLYRRHGREMPANNRAQAYFPRGSVIVPNPEGTAPGIDLTILRDQRSPCRVFALPGVPVEMEQMWAATVQAELKKLANDDSTFHHFTLHCFGSGESTIESLLPNLIERGRDPQVGITASAATISLRISTRGKNQEDCLTKMQPTIATIHELLGQLVFGVNGQTLESVVLDLLAERGLKLAIADAGLGGEVMNLLKSHEGDRGILKGQELFELGLPGNAAENVRLVYDADVGLAIGETDWDEQEILNGRSRFHLILSTRTGSADEMIQIGGHSAWRRQRAIKQVLNFVRLQLPQSPAGR